MGADESKPKSDDSAGKVPPDSSQVPLNVPKDTDQQHTATLDDLLNYGDVGRLNITVDQAKLVKNYGIARMDPYVRLRVGHYIFQTDTDKNGAKTPHWNKTVQCALPPGVNSINIEIYDECLTTDDLIAWAQIPIPDVIFLGKIHDEWYKLDGEQGVGLEGTISLILSYSTAPSSASPPVATMTDAGSSSKGSAKPYAAVPAYQPSQGLLSPQEESVSKDSLKTVEEQFPNLDKDYIESVWEANGGNRVATIKSLWRKYQR